jgi:hypothetical protein
MRHGEVDFMPCIHACREVRFLDRTAQFGALSAGFEHQFASGWSLRYDFGIGRALMATPWRCVRRDGAPAACENAPPGDDLPLTSFAVGYTL